MTFPQDPLGARFDLRAGSVWTDITSDVYTRDAITVTRGRSDEGARVDAGKLTLTVNNGTGKYSPRNPLSPYYGLIGRNTQMRVSIPGPSYLATDGRNLNSIGASTPDASVLDITGDLDVRFDATLTNWIDSGSIELVGKANTTSNQRSWLLMMRDGRLHLEWSVDGINTIQKESTQDLPVTPSRLAVRFTLDVNNGASGNTVTFYTAPTIAGTWTQLGDPVITSGTTSIFNSTAALFVGQAIIGVGFPSAAGKIHACEVRNGIAGTVVANPNFSAQTAGATSFTDAAGRAWTVAANSQISDRWMRFTGEVSAWPPRWAPSGRDVWVPLEGAGMLRRLGQGRKPLDSTLRRRVPSYSPLAYWPMEEAATATRAYSPIAGVQPLTFSQVKWAGADSLPSSNALPTLASLPTALPKMSGPVPAPKTAITGWQVRWVYRIDAGPASLYTFMRILCTGGTVDQWYVQMRSDIATILGVDSDGVLVVNQPIGLTAADTFGQWATLNFNVFQSATNTVTWQVIWQNVGGDALGFSTTFTGKIGRVKAVASPPDGFSVNLDGMAIGHIAVFGSNTTAAYDGAITGYDGESTLDRLGRLTSEEGLPIARYDGDGTRPSTPLGPQTPSTVLDLLEACGDSDGGVFYEQRDQLGLAYRDHTSLYNQTPALTLTYGQVATSLEPTEDDQNIRNDITVVRQGGSSARVTIDDGPLSTLPPEEGGVGIYDESVTLSLGDDDQPAQIAGWLAHLGTWDEARYPQVRLLLHKLPELIPAVLTLDSGDVIRITGMPPWLAPGDLDLMIQGYSEKIGTRTWEITFNCTPAGPWTVGIVGDAVLGRADTELSLLASGVSSSATSLSVSTVDGPVWTTDPTDVPMDVLVGGEVMTVTAISGTSSPQTFTVTRHVNGVTKAQTALTDVRLATPTIVAL